MYKVMCVAGVLLATSLAAAELAEKVAKRLESADATYNAAVQKADNSRFYAVQKAGQERLRALKAALTDVTKAGDFEAATEIQNRLSAAESSGAVRSKPKNLTKFNGHDYAVIDEKVTWHAAKKRAEEMGGHLVIIETPQEELAILKLANEANIEAWIGATDEEKEGDWKWVDGSPVRLGQVAVDNTLEAEHCLHFSTGTHKFNDHLGGIRIGYIVEFEK